ALCAEGSDMELAATMCAAGAAFSTKIRDFGREPVVLRQAQALRLSVQRFFVWKENCTKRREIFLSDVALLQVSGFILV
ncbi:MAG: hypothetical protein LUE89_08635, partial [Clostridiales bacterium]|nr:hypothetical protein [Clostridiales bacterium]